MALCPAAYSKLSCLHTCERDAQRAVHGGHGVERAKEGPQSIQRAPEGGATLQRLRWSMHGTFCQPEQENTAAMMLSGRRRDLEASRTLLRPVPRPSVCMHEVARGVGTVGC